MNRIRPDRALLVGIDHYLESLQVGGLEYPALRGSVRDVTLLRDCLHSRLGVKREVDLLVSHEGASSSAQPTYEAIVAAFRRLSEAARSGEQILVHYSGHGGRAETHYPELKGREGVDEVLVPWNAREPSSRLLRDVELAALLARITESGAWVTVVLDCCHSGGAVRSTATPRGIPGIDRVKRPCESAVDTALRLRRSWENLVLRSLDGLSGWLPTIPRCTVLAACRADEQAYEVAFGGEGPEGVLSHLLRRQLERLSEETTYVDLHRLLLAGAQSLVESQTPQIEGEASRRVFGLAFKGSPKPYVKAVDGDAIFIAAGRAHGVSQGDVFVAGDAEGAGALQRPPRIEVVSVGASGSLARALGEQSQRIELGSSLRLVEAGADAPKVLVRLSPRLLQADAVAAALAGSYPRLHTARRHEQADLVVESTGASFCVISTSSRTPERPVTVPERDVEALVTCVVHMARFLEVLRIHNPLREDGLARAVELDFFPLEAPYDPEQARRPRLAQTPIEHPIFEEGEPFAIRISNRSVQTLYVSLLNLRPDWSIVRLLPASREEPWCVLESGYEEVLVVRPSLPQPLELGRDHLKMIVTVDDADVSTLELLPLISEEGSLGSPTRSFDSSFELYADWDWYAVDRCVHVRR